MVWRIVLLLIWQFAGGWLGWILAGQLPGAAQPASEARSMSGLITGIVLASIAWLGWDFGNASRLLTWLKRGDAAAPVRVSGVWNEVQARMRKWLKAGEGAAALSEGRLQDFLAAMQASPNGVVLLDVEGRIEWFNQTASLHFGFEAGRDLAQLIGNLVRHPAFAAYLHQQDFRRGIVMPGKGASAARPVQLAVQMHPYGEGRSLLLSRDITALEQADAMRRDFVANVSHEIRTPLTVVSGFVETMQSMPLDEAQRQRYLGLVAVQTHRMQTLVNDLLTLSRLEGSAPVPLSPWISVGPLMHAVVAEAGALSASLAEARAPQHRIEWIGEDVAQQTALAGSPNELPSAFANLVGNAVRYTPTGGLIQIEWSTLADGRAEFSVRDSGPGIDAEHVPRLTERFYRVDRSRSRDTGGTGLGLAIVKHVAQRHEAELRIETQPGAGSRFSLVFPANRLRQADIG